MASAYVAIARCCVLAYQYQPPAPSTPTAAIAATPMSTVRVVGSVMPPSSDAEPSTVLTAARPAASPALGHAAYEVSTVRTALVREQAQDEPEARHDRRAHDQHRHRFHGNPASEQIDEDGALLDGHREAGHLHGGVVDVGAGRHVPPPGVPGARHDGAIEVALAERPPAVGAGVVDHVVGAVDVEQRQRLAVSLDD